MPLYTWCKIMIESSLVICSQPFLTLVFAICFQYLSISPSFFQVKILYLQLWKTNTFVITVISQDSSGCLNHVQHKCNLLVANCDDLRSCNWGLFHSRCQVEFTSFIHFVYIIVHMIFVYMYRLLCEGVMWFMCKVWKNLVIDLELCVFSSTWRRETEGTNVEPNSHSSPEAHVADVRGVSL